MFFGHTKFGDLRKHLSGFFDTSSGMKVRTRDAAWSHPRHGPENLSLASFRSTDAVRMIAMLWFGFEQPNVSYVLA